MTAHTTSPWQPRSGFETVEGYVWLPRMLDKLRRAETHPMGDYMVLDGSLMDRLALMHFRVDGETLRGWVREGLSDGAIALRLAEALGEGPADRARFSRRFLMLTGLFVRALDAEEGRTPPGPATAMLKALIGVTFQVAKRLPLGPR